MGEQKAAEHLVRIGAVKNLELVLGQFGLDAETELAKLSMSPEMFQDGELLMHVRNVVEVLEHCARVTDCPDFSLRLAAEQDMSVIGVLALFLKTASTLGEALQEICRYQHVHHAQPVTWHLQDLGNVVTFDFFLDGKGLSTKQYRLGVDLGLAQGWGAVRTLAEGRVRLKAVRLRGDQRGELQSYRNYFQAPIEFNAEVNGLVLSAGACDVPLSHSDAQMHEAVRQQISPIESGAGASSLISEVCTIIRSLLPTGNSSLDRVAKCYSCDKRTLQRHLMKEAGTTYQALLDEVRFDLVQQYLCDSRMPVTQIAYAVGFTDPSNFARAFRNRFGVSPRRWRAQHRPGKPLSRSSNLSFHKI